MQDWGEGPVLGESWRQRVGMSLGVWIMVRIISSQIQDKGSCFWSVGLVWVKCSLDYSLCFVFTKTDPEIRIWVQIVSLRSGLRRLGKKWEGRGKTHKGDIHEHITTGASGVQSPVDPLRDHVANTPELSHLQSKEIGRFIHKFPSLAHGGQCCRDDLLLAYLTT